MFSQECNQAGHVKRLTVRLDQHGWEVREESDETVVRVEHYSDWHRVERTIQRFRVEQARAALGA